MTHSNHFQSLIAQSVFTDFFSFFTRITVLESTLKLIFKGLFDRCLIFKVLHPLSLSARLYYQISPPLSIPFLNFFIPSSQPRRVFPAFLLYIVAAERSRTTYGNADFKVEMKIVKAWWNKTARRQTAGEKILFRFAFILPHFEQKVKPCYHFGNMVLGIQGFYKPHKTNDRRKQNG